ncbi:mucin-binding protein [Lactobacillus sp. PV034]|uniref:mucin-binding protein n=1 Tax=Lactobacillus sp. PV034 TaxID=2594495 RepID=UPI00223FD75E|nr:YSIRK-type signal peptide-containing protein [Lactobacillus sp. PV034]QNQ80439.1 YSIRK-type signal peptide-containing protein [Lactobacillus sp. PV034]
MENKNKTKNNKKLVTSETTQHYSIRKFSVGVASALIGTTLFLGANSQKVQAADNKPTVTEESNSQLASGKDNLDSKSDNLSGKEQALVAPSNEKKDSNATNPSVEGNETNEQVSASAQDDIAKQELTGDTNGSGNLDKQQLSHKATSINTDSNKFELTSTITNNADYDDKNIFVVTVLPNTKDGKSEFNTHLTGPVEVSGSENAENMTNWYVTGEAGQSLDKLLIKDSEGNYVPTKEALESATVEGYFKVKKWKQADWDKVTAVITTVDSLKSKSNLTIHLHTYDPTVETDVSKNAYMSQAVMDSTSFKKLRTGRTINFVNGADKSLGSQKQSINDVAIYHTNAVTGDMVGDTVLEKGLPGFEIPTFDGYNFKSISGGNNEFWQDYNPDNPTEILPIKTIKNLQDAKVSTRTGYAQIPNYTITVMYDTVTDNTASNAGRNTNALTLFNMLAAVPQTPDQVEQHTSIINPGDSNSAKLTVVGKQKINISYIDDTEGKQLGQTDSVEGLPGETAAYSTADRINEYKKQGYDLVSDGTKSPAGQSTLIYDNDYQTDQNFEVHLKHDTKPIDDDSTVTETIHYIYKDGTTASPDKVQTINFKRTGTKDLVTQDVTWNPVDPQTFAKVDSPEITGYTPDLPAIDAITVNFGDLNIEKTVTYTANDQNAKITYIDDTTGTSLKSEAANGKFGELIEFPTDVDNQIKAYEDKGYEFVSNNFESNKYQADNAKNVFEVHLTHGYTTPEITVRHATWTINYVGSDHNPESNHQEVTFTRTVYTDKVNNEVHDSGYVPDNQFKDIKSPAVAGYSLYNPAENAVVHQDTKLGENDSDIHYVTTVPYVKDRPGTDLPDPMESRQSTWTIHYVGLDKNPEDVVQTVHFIKEGDKFVPTTSFKDIDSPKVDGYDVDIPTAHQDTVLGKDNTDGNFETTVIYTKPSQFVDTDTPVESHRATLTINYVGTDNNPKSVVQTVYFFKKNGKFVPTGNFEDVVSPEINGYRIWQPKDEPTKYINVHQDTKLGENDTDIDYVVDVPYVKDEPGIDLPNPVESTSQTWTIHYVGLDKNPEDKVQTIHFIKKGDKFVPVDFYEDVTSPEEKGYNVDTKIAKAENAKVLPDGNLETTVIYTKPVAPIVDTPIAGEGMVPPEVFENPEAPIPNIYIDTPGMESTDQTWTIHYVGLDKNPDDVVQTIHFIKKGDKFVPIDSYEAIPSPEVAGYDVDTKVAHAKNATVLHDGNLVTFVIYTKLNTFVDTPPLTDKKVPKDPDPEIKIPDEPTPVRPTPKVPQHPTPNKTPAPVPDPIPDPKLIPRKTPLTPDEYARSKAQTLGFDVNKTRPEKQNKAKVIPKQYLDNRFLPQTGKRSSSADSILGLAALSLSGLMSLAATKKKKHN